MANKDDKKITFPKYLLAKKDRAYTVVGYVGDVDFYTDNKCYIDKKTGQIYVCSIKEKPRHDDVPIVFIDDKGKATYAGTKNPTTLKEFRVENLRDLSVDYILENTSEDEVLYNEKELADMNAATSTFIPIINDDDDPLKRIIKMAILEKNIDINRLKHKLPQKYGLTNMKSALVGSTKMSITGFKIWCELLEVNFEIAVFDNGKDAQDPLKTPLHYSSSDDRVEKFK